MRWANEKRERLILQYYLFRDTNLIINISSYEIFVYVSSIYPSSLWTHWTIGAINNRKLDKLTTLMLIVVAVKQCLNTMYAICQLLSAAIMRNVSSGNEHMQRFREMFPTDTIAKTSLATSILKNPSDSISHVILWRWIDSHQLLWCITWTVM